MFRRLIILTALLASAGLATAGTAFAAAATPGHFAYNDAVVGPVTCNETHHPTNDLPGQFLAGAVTTGGWDEVNCTLATARPDLAGQDVTEGWFSDFVFEHSPSLLPPGTDTHLGSIQVHYNGDGTHEIGVAWYPNN
jgi:hypothetical protein